MDLPQHISYSQVKMFLDCPRKYEAAYIERRVRDDSLALIFGKAYHQALETGLNAKMRGEELGPNLMDEVVEHAWSEVMKDGNADDIQDEENEIDKLKHLVGLYWAEVAPSVIPSAVELKFSIPIPGVDVPFVGIIDLIDNGFLVDHKTSNKSWSQSRADSDLQVTAYTYAYWAMRGEFPLGFRFDVAVKELKTPKIMQLDTARTKNQVLWFESMLPIFWRAVKNGVFVPNPTGFLCHKLYCPIWGECVGQ